MIISCITNSIVLYDTILCRFSYLEIKMQAGLLDKLAYWGLSSRPLLMSSLTFVMSNIKSS